MLCGHPVVKALEADHEVILSLRRISGGTDAYVPLRARSFTRLTTLHSLVAIDGDEGSAIVA